MIWFQNLQSLIESNAYVNGSIKLLITALIFYGLYRFLMSPFAEPIRKLFAPLRAAHSSKAVSALIKEGEYAKAGDMLLQMGEQERAIEVFQQGKLYGRAADVYADRKNLSKAILLYERAGDLKKVAEIYLKTRSFEKLEELFGRHNRLPELALIYEEAKKNQRAAEMYQKVSNFYKAAENYLIVGDEFNTARMLEEYFYQAWRAESPELLSSPSKKVAEIAAKAGVLYEKCGKWDEALELHKKTQNKKAMAKVLAQKGDYFEAARLAEEGGDFKLASEFFSKGGNTQGSARLQAEHLFQEGDLLSAIDKFKEAQEYSRCAEIYTELQELHKAAEMHELAGEFYAAGKIYMDEKKYLQAGANFEKAGYLDNALEAYKEGKLDHKIVEVLKKSKKHYELADYFIGKKQFDQALAAIDPIEKKDPNYRFALFIRGKIFYNQGDYPNALKKFEEAVTEIPGKMTAPDLDIIHHYALAEQYLNIVEFKSLEMLELRLAQNQIETRAIDKAQNLIKMIRDKSVSRVSQSKILSWRTSGATSGSSPRSNPYFVQDALGEKRYSIIKELGRGGMGVVYLAKDSKLDREVALKILPSSIRNNERIIQTFLREAKSAAALNHPNIVTVFDTGIQDGDYYIAMENIDGKTIKKILKHKGKFAYPIALELLKQLFAGLEYAHSKMVIHRDLTTSNIMWTRQKLVKIMDFGLAKVIHNLQSEQSIIGGTPSFMSPEQTLGKPADHRTDIYSLGVCMFEMALGTLPFTKGDLGYHHVHTSPPIPKEIDPSIPTPLNDAILKCMQKNPEDRFQNVGEIAKLLFGSN